MFGAEKLSFSCVKIQRILTDFFETQIEADKNEVFVGSKFSILKNLEVFKTKGFGTTKNQRFFGGIKWYGKIHHHMYAGEEIKEP